MSAYEHGAALHRKLEADLARLNAAKEATEQQIRDLGESCRQMLAREQRIRTRINETLTNAAKRQDQIITRARKAADEATSTAAREVDDIIARAHQEATSIIASAEARAGLIKEQAYDQGRALADREYAGMHNPGRSRRNDSTRARRMVLGNLGVTA